MRLETPTAIPFQFAKDDVFLPRLRRGRNTNPLAESTGNAVKSRCSVGPRKVLGKSGGKKGEVFAKWGKTWYSNYGFCRHVCKA